MRWLRGVFASIMGYMVLPASVLATDLAPQGAPAPWQMGFQAAASPQMHAVTYLHDLLLWVIFTIGFLVVLMVGFVCWRFRATRNPIPSNTTHNTWLEVIWTGIPVIILALFVLPSLRVLYLEDHVPDAEMTVKIVAHQWYWTYTYPDQGGLEFDSLMVPDADIKPGQLRLLSVDRPVVVPAGKTVRLQITSADVIHSWAMPALGVKKDAVPGRLNESWIRVERPGIYYGQCSELCGPGHGFMPIELHALPPQEFEAWLTAQTSDEPQTMSNPHDTK